MQELKITYPTTRTDLFQGICDTHCFKVYGIPKDCIQMAINDFDPDMRMQGIYFLVNKSEAKSSKRYIYIGQTTQGPHRLVNHRQTKKDWDYAYMFLAEKERMTNTIINELEALEINHFKSSPMYNCVNGRPNRATISSLTNMYCKSIEEILDFFNYPLYESTLLANISDSNVFSSIENNSTKVAYNEEYFFNSKLNELKTDYQTLKNLLLSKSLVPKYNKNNISFKNSKGKSVVNLIIYKSYIEVVLGLKLGEIIDPQNITYDISTRQWSAMQYAFKYNDTLNEDYVKYLIDQACKN